MKKRSEPQPGDLWVSRTEGEKERFQRNKCMTCMHGRHAPNNHGRRAPQRRAVSIGCELWKQGILNGQSIGAWTYDEYLEPMCLDYEPALSFLCCDEETD
jgi:hypothetical protein